MAPRPLGRRLTGRQTHATWATAVPLLLLLLAAGCKPADQTAGRHAHERHGAVRAAARLPGRRVEEAYLLARGRIENQATRAGA